MSVKRVLLPTSLAILILATPAAAQTWWTGGEGNSEAGKLQELKLKQRVYLNVVFTTTEPEINAQQEQTLIRNMATRVIAEYKGLTLVGTPDQAELAISIVASQTNSGPGGTTQLARAASQDPNLETPLEVTVLVRGAQQRNGSYRPRVVWTTFTSNVQGEPGPASAFAINGFIEQLKRVREESK
jgi:hypothetical protein